MAAGATPPFFCLRCLPSSIDFSSATAIRNPNMPTPIITDGSTDRVPNAPRVVLPDTASLFADRASRFLQRAQGHAMGEYLRLMGAVAEAQHTAVARRAAPAVAESLLAASRDYGMPPLAALSHARDPSWRDDLRDIARAVSSQAPAAKSVLALDETSLEAIADRVLGATTLDEDAAAVPFVGAALQVYFSRLAATMNAADLMKSDVPVVCPVCATRPVASVIRIGGERNGLRYLVCALCSTEWNLPRILCSACESDKGVHYLSLQNEADTGERDAFARAEACDECNSYLKIFSQEKDAHVEATADDLASLALDVLVDEQGFGRSGPNLLFHPGSG